MARMNNKKVVNKVTEDIKLTTNHEGSRVHDLSALESLFSKVLGSFFGESTHYEKRDAESDFIKLVETINKVDYRDIEYVLKIALLGREHNMIQYPLAVLTACFNDERFKGSDFLDANGRNKLQFYSDRVVRRSRDIVDIMAMQINAYGFEKVPDGKPFGPDKRFKRDLPLPMQLRKALKHKLETFNAYQLSKGLSESRDVTLSDCIKLLHPNEKVAKVPKGYYKQIIEGKVLLGNDTKQVQSELAKSRNANSESTIKDVIESLETSTIMALVKNLVALQKSGAFDDPKAVDIVVRKLTDKRQILGSRLLPFRFYSAWVEYNNECKYGYTYMGLNTRRISEALVEALDLSIDNLPKIEGYSAILIDVSGSMRRNISSKSNVMASDIACLLGAICFKQGIADVYTFASQCNRVNDISTRDSVMTIMNNISKQNKGGCTYIDTALNMVSSSKQNYDNLIILSDNDCYYQTDSNSFTLGERYCGGNKTDNIINNMIKSGTIKRVYLNNLLGNDFAIVNTDDYRKNLITGFSEKIVDMINVYSTLGKGASDIRVMIDRMIDNLSK